MRDVNETGYHLLLGDDDWNRCTGDENDTRRKWEYIQAEQRHVVQLQQEVFRFSSQGTTDSPLTQAARRGAALDTYGHWYWINQTEIGIEARWAKGSGKETIYPRIERSVDHASIFKTKANRQETAAKERLVGLAATPEGYLVAGLPESGSLLVIDLYSSDGPPLRIPLANGTQPFDISNREDGGLYVLDSESAQVWSLDRHLQVEPHQSTTEGKPLSFQPKNGTVRHGPAERVYTPFSLVALAALPASTGCSAWDSAKDRAVAIEALPDGSFWILNNRLDEPLSYLWHIFPEELNRTRCFPLKTKNLVGEAQDDLDLTQIRAHDIAYLPDEAPAENDESRGTLYVADENGNQAYALRYEKGQLRLEREYYPLRGFNGTAIHTNRSKRELYYHQGERWQPLKPLPRRRYEAEAQLLLPAAAAFDGKEPNCVWHRLCVDACIPQETEIVVETRAAETVEDLQWGEWIRQPALYKRPNGSEIPYSDLWGDQISRNNNTGTWELLFQRTVGRYMQFRLTLRGNIRSTPLIRALRAHYPRFSYLKEYLPAVYAQDAVSAQFVENFLANPEGTYTLIEGLIAQVQSLIDVRSVPVEAVEWLAHWLGLVFEPGWTDYQRRLLIAQAPYFFKRRGTLPGLMQAILLAISPELGPAIFQDDIANQITDTRIIESFFRRTYSGVGLGDTTNLSDGTVLAESEGESADNDLRTEAEALAHQFAVLLPASLGADTQRLVERIIDLEKPAHTLSTVKQFWALFRVGGVRVGFDTILGEGGRFETFRLNQTALAEGMLDAAFPHDLTNRTVLSK